MRELVQHGVILESLSFTPILVRGRYGALLREEARNALISQVAIPWGAVFALQSAIWFQAIEATNVEDYRRIAQHCLEMLNSQKLITRHEGAQECVVWLRHLRNDDERLNEFSSLLQQIGTSIVPMLFSNAAIEIYAADWAIYELILSRRWDPPVKPDLLGRLFDLWQHHEEERIRKNVGTTILTPRLLPRGSDGPCATIQPAEFEQFVQNYDKLDSRSEKPAALIIAWYLRTPWSDAELVTRIRSLVKDISLTSHASRTLKDILMELGEAP